ncbi:MAG TPA: thioredoxin family protein [Verrucomicrobiales bacterium]|nr:thioredoxin family protein [Verrucomicrobiales bacterium]
MISTLSRLFALPALILTITTARAAEGWTEDFEKAKATAAKDNRDLLIEFTGSDWCPYCVQLKKEVFNKDAFKTEAPKSFVLVELDFPRKKEQAPEIKAQNEKLEKQYAVDGYPTVILADAQGRPYAVIGYEEGGPAKYMERLTELRKVREKRDESFKKASAAEGVEKAKHIMAAIEDIDENLVQSFYKKELDEAVAADKDDVTGVKLMSKMGALNEELAALHAAEKFDEFTKRIDKFIKDERVTGEKKQELLLTKLAVNGPDKIEASLKLIDEVIAVDPKSDMAEQAKMIKENLQETMKEIEKSKKDLKDEDDEETKPTEKKKPEKAAKEKEEK